MLLKKACGWIWKHVWGEYVCIVVQIPCNKEYVVVLDNFCVGCIVGDVCDINLRFWCGCKWCILMM